MLEQYSIDLESNPTSKSTVHAKPSPKRAIEDNDDPETELDPSVSSDSESEASDIVRMTRLKSNKLSPPKPTVIRKSLARQAKKAKLINLEDDGNTSMTQDTDDEENKKL